jgi:hypothetical protein
VYKVLVEKPGGKRTLGKPRCKWKDNIKTDIQELERGGMNWVALAQDRGRWWALVNATLNFWVPLNVGNILTRSEPVSFSRRTLLCGVS